MTLRVILISLFVLSSFSVLIDNEELWHIWKIQHKKSYTKLQESDRYPIFMENYNKIREWNAQNHSVQLGLNKFADLTSAEFKKKHTGCAKYNTVDKSSQGSFRPSNFANLPEEVDWRESGVVSDVKDQGSCGSCWAFSAVGALETYYALHVGALTRFSEQQIVDCDRSSAACDGGLPSLALEYASKNGLELETDYPYTGMHNECKYKKEKAIQIHLGYASVAPRNRDALKAAISIIPTTVGVEASEPIFQFYKTGVVGAGCSGSDVDHAVLAVGYKKIDHVEAFIIKNSWGDDWGDNGYIYLATDDSLNKGVGACGILTMPVFPF